jgi:hypothetical protein
MADRFFWLDEVQTFQTAILPFWDIPKNAAVTSGQMQPPLFYWLGHFASYIGTDPFTLRSVSLACYIVMIGYAVFLIREFQLGTRIFLCLVLIHTNFAAFATTEFRPYALAALAILVSNVCLYRALKQPARWPPILQYGCAALVLQYSLTLNCYAFGLQVGLIFLFLLVSAANEGVLKTYISYKPLIIVALFLCVEYAAFIYVVVASQDYRPNDLLGGYGQHLYKNLKVLGRSLLIESGLVYLVNTLFIIGCVIGFVKNRLVLVYLLLLLGGQWIFSTYMTYSRVSWFSERYLVASYVSYALICALGAEYLFRRIGKKLSIVILVILLFVQMQGAITNYIKAINIPSFNPATTAIDALRCKNTQTVVISDPGYINKIPWYAYRNNPLLIVPISQKEVDSIITQSALKGHCFILQEVKYSKAYDGHYFNRLTNLSGYTGKQYAIKRGLHVPDSAWLFAPK